MFDSDSHWEDSDSHEEHTVPSTDRRSNKEIWQTAKREMEPTIFMEMTSQHLKNQECAGGGNVKLTYPDGSVYTGKISLRAPHTPNGQGRKVFPDRSYLEGQWKNGLLHGKGTRCDKFGKTVSGNWRNGIFQTGEKEKKLMAKKMVSLRHHGKQAESLAIIRSSQREKSLPGNEKSFRKLKGGGPPREKIPSPPPFIGGFYTKVERLEKIKSAWHPYPRQRQDNSAASVAKAKVDIKISSAKRDMDHKQKKSKSIFLRKLNLLKSKYRESRKVFVQSLQRDSSMARQNFARRRESILSLAAIRGGSGREHALVEIKRVKKKYFDRQAAATCRVQAGLKILKQNFLDDLKAAEADYNADCKAGKTKFLSFAWKRRNMEANEERNQRHRSESKTRHRRNPRCSHDQFSLNHKLSNQYEEQRARREQYRLDILQKVLRPSLVEELLLAFLVWRRHAEFITRRETLRHDLISSGFASSPLAPRVADSSEVAE